MLKYQYPFSDTVLNNQTKVFVDACFLLVLLDEKHDMFNKCEEVLEFLLNSNCKFFISNVVAAEVLNRTINKSFMSDIGYRHSSDILNSMENINKLITYFYPKEQDIILKADEQTFNKKRFVNHFDYILKETEDSELLKVYFEESVLLLQELEDELGLQCLPTNGNMLISAKDVCSKYLLGINDAQHLAVSIAHRMDYILTLDGDFEKIPVDKVKILKIEKEDELEQTGTEN